MSGRAIPPRLLEPPPEVNEGLQLYMDAFWNLCADRGFGNRIRWTAMHFYASSLGLSYEEEWDMVFLLNRLDMTYLKWLEGKQRRGQPEGSSQQNGPPIAANPRRR